MSLSSKPQLSFRWLLAFSQKLKPRQSKIMISIIKWHFLIFVSPGTDAKSECKYDAKEHHHRYHQANRNVCLAISFAHDQPSLLPFFAEKCHLFSNKAYSQSLGTFVCHFFAIRWESTIFGTTRFSSSLRLFPFLSLGPNPFPFKRLSLTSLHL